MSLANKSKKGHFTGHEAILNHFMRHGKHVTISDVRGHVYMGVIKAFDNYTISIQETDTDFPVVIFKSAVVNFYSRDTSEAK